MLSKSLSRKVLAITAVTLVLVACLVAGTIAYLQDKTGMVENTFTVGTAPTPEIEETFDGTTKKDVYVKLSDDGAGSYYVRAAVIFTLQDDAGNTLAQVPANGTDYTIKMGSGWTEMDDYWYYDEAVVPGGFTADLIEECVTLNTEYRLVVDILAQTIQSNPTTAAETYWGYVPGSSSTSN